MDIRGEMVGLSTDWNKESETREEFKDSKILAERELYHSSLACAHKMKPNKKPRPWRYTVPL